MTLLTIREASQLIGRTPATIRRYIRSGRLQAEKEIGKFGEEYKINREDLLALGFSAAGGSLPARVEQPGQPASTGSLEGSVPVSLFNELLMKHEQILVQYGMIRAGGQKLLEYKADAEAKEESLRGAEARFQALRARAAKEIKFLRRHLREAEIEIEDRNIEITLLQEKIKRLELAAAGVATIQSFDSDVTEIREKERTIAQLESTEPVASPTYDPPEAWFEPLSPKDGGEDH
jgi:excisionase family DNA binding protein